MVFTDIGDHFEVRSSLENLNSQQIRSLGGALGLSYPRLERMNNILDDMTAAWLNKEDSVLRKSGEPTWNRLVEALERIGQMGVAEEIKNKKRCSDTEKEVPRNSKKHISILPYLTFQRILLDVKKI